MKNKPRHTHGERTERLPSGRWKRGEAFDSASMVNPIWGLRVSSSVRPAGSRTGAGRTERVSQGVGAALAGPDADDAVDRNDPALAVADLLRLRRRDDRVDDLIDGAV